MKHLFILALSLSAALWCYGQGCPPNQSIPKNAIGPDEGSRAGSCASPDGVFTGDVLAAYPPDYAYLFDSGYCHTFTPVVKNATVCYEFTAPGSDIDINAGYDPFLCAGVVFSLFNLYTCAPACTFIGSGITFTGLTPGQCYTWCVNVKCVGGGASAGFETWCPYVVYSIALPVELSNFSCFQKNNVVYLQWATQFEERAKYFEVLKSANGVDFVTIGQVDANGNSDYYIDYQFEDVNPGSQNYYQLKQVNSDNSYSKSDIIYCGLEQEVSSIHYYTLMGQQVDYRTCPNGVYIKELLYHNKRTQELVYLSENR